MEYCYLPAWIGRASEDSLFLPVPIERAEMLVEQN
jgi:hypothetical protein